MQKYGNKLRVIDGYGDFTALTIELKPDQRQKHLSLELATATSYMNKLGFEYLLVAELHPTSGHLHFHGIVKVRGKHELSSFAKKVKKLFGYYKLHEIYNMSGWLRYCYADYAKTLTKIEYKPSFFTNTKELTNCDKYYTNHVYEALEHEATRKFPLILGSPEKDERNLQCVDESGLKRSYEAELDYWYSTLIHPPERNI